MVAKTFSFAHFTCDRILRRGGLATERADISYHGRDIPTVERLEGQAPVQVVMIVNWGAVSLPRGPISSRAERQLLNDCWDWFCPHQFRREVHSHGHINYFRDPPSSKRKDRQFSAASVNKSPAVRK